MRPDIMEMFSGYLIPMRQITRLSTSETEPLDLETARQFVNGTTDHATKHRAEKD